MRTHRLAAVVAACLVTFASVSQAQLRGGAATSFDAPVLTGGSITLPAVLYKAPDPSKGVVVLMHGSDGWNDHREGYYGRTLVAAGYSALAVDTYGPRGITGTIADQSKLSIWQQDSDAFAARRFLVAQGFPADKIAIMGFSRGGTVAFHVADMNFTPKEADRFKLAIPFYAACATRPRQPKPTSALYVVLAEKDDWTGTKSCEAAANAHAAAGGKVTTKLYPGASHGFDGSPEHTRLTRVWDAATLVDCQGFIEPDGSASYDGKGYPNYVGGGNPDLATDMNKTCVKKGATVWTNVTQKEAVTRDVIDFLNANM